MNKFITADQTSKIRPLIFVLFIFIYGALTSNIAYAQNMLSGTVTLPTDVVSDGNVFVEVSVQEFDSTGSFINFSGFSAAVPTDSDTLSYSLDYPEPAIGSELLVEFLCSSGCLEVDANQFTFFRLQDDGSISPSFNQIDAATVPSTLDFQFPEPPTLVSLSGEISLPTDVVSDGNVFVQVSVQEFDSTGNFINSNSFVDAVPTDSGTLSYNVDYPEPAIGNELLVGFSCSSGCLEVDANQFTFFSLQDDGSFSPSVNQIDAATVPSTLDFQFPEPPALVSLSYQVTGGIPTNAGVTVVVNTFDNNGAFLGSVIGFGQSGSVLVPDSAEVARYEVFYFCDEFFDGVTNVDDCPDHVPAQSPLTVNSLPSTAVDLPFINSINVNFETTVQTQSTESISINVLGTVFDQNDIQIRQFDTSAFINANSTSTNTDPFFRKIPEAPVGGYYQLEFSCNQFSDCSNYIASGDPSYTIQVQADAIPDPIAFTLLDIVLIQPDAFEVDNTAEMASTIRQGQSQIHTIHEGGDVDFARLTLTDSGAGEPTTNIRVEALANPQTTNLQVILRDSSGSEIGRHDDEIDSQETANPQLSAIDVVSLPSGDYTIEVRAFSPAESVDEYTLRVTHDTSDDELCVPIRARNGAIALICL